MFEAVASVHHKGSEQNHRTEVEQVFLCESTRVEPKLHGKLDVAICGLDLFEISERHHARHLSPSVWVERLARLFGFWHLTSPQGGSASRVVRPALRCRT